MHALERMTDRPSSQKARVVSAVLPFLKSDDVRVQMGAMDTLTVWTDRDVVPTLLSFLGSDQTPVCRTHAIALLATFKDPRAIDPLANLIAQKAIPANTLEPYEVAAEDAWLRVLKQLPEQEVVDGIAKLAVKYGTAKSLEAFEAIVNDPLKALITAPPKTSSRSSVLERARPAINKSE